MLKSIEYAGNRLWRIVDDTFTVIFIVPEYYDSNCSAICCAIAAVITVYEQQKLPIAPNIVRAYNYIYNFLVYYKRDFKSIEATLNTHKEQFNCYFANLNYNKHYPCVLNQIKQFKYINNID